MHSIQMLDLKSQYNKIKLEIDSAIQDVINSSAFINGKQVKQFEENLGLFLNSHYVIACANGTDALQIALMALELHPGDEVIVPAFTYAATAEVIALLGLIPIMIDVDKQTFNISIPEIEKAITSKTKAIIPVHLFGQSADMEPIMIIAAKYNLWVIEDNAQALAAEYTFSNGKTFKTGTIGHIGCTSFFPSKNLGCFGDGGALCTNDDVLASKIRMIANHGQKVKYYHSIIGCNSRLDTIQAAILNVKLHYLPEYIKARQDAARFYDQGLSLWDKGIIPIKKTNSKHSYNQYTLQIKNGERNRLQLYLAEQKIPSMIYYPIPLYEQDAFKKYVPLNMKLSVTEELCNQVISLPIHTEITNEELQFVIQKLLLFQINA
jgi:dTDP-4-amino-4,6-dideoxygalactose transaminase